MPVLTVALEGDLRSASSLTSPGFIPVSSISASVMRHWDFTHSAQAAAAVITSLKAFSYSTSRFIPTQTIKRGGRSSPIRR